MSLRGVIGSHRCRAVVGLQGLGELRGEGALGRGVFRVLGAFALTVASLDALRRRRPDLTLRLGGLSRIGAQQTVFERRAIEAANNRLHLIRGWGFHEGESFRLL